MEPRPARPTPDHICGRAWAWLLSFARGIELLSAVLIEGQSRSCMLSLQRFGYFAHTRLGAEGVWGQPPRLARSASRPSRQGGGGLGSSAVLPLVPGLVQDCWPKLISLKRKKGGAWLHINLSSKRRTQIIIKRYSILQPRQVFCRDTRFRRFSAVTVCIRYSLSCVVPVAMCSLQRHGLCQFLCRGVHIA
jgi:hypothetical protein